MFYLIKIALQSRYPENYPLIFYDDLRKITTDKLKLNVDVSDAYNGGQKRSREVTEGVDREPLGLAHEAGFKAGVGKELDGARCRRNCDCGCAGRGAGGAVRGRAAAHARGAAAGTAGGGAQARAGTRSRRGAQATPPNTATSATPPARTTRRTPKPTTRLRHEGRELGGAGAAGNTQGKGSGHLY